MKKPLLLLFFSFVCFVAQSQFSSLNGDCGTCKEVKSYGKWEDLTGNIASKDTSWVLDEERSPRTESVSVPAVYCPCGCGFPYRMTQLRVCRRTGWQQRRVIEVTFTYIPKPKSKYQTVIDSLNSKHR